MHIVVTGMGVVSPVGQDVDAFWAALCAGESGIAELTRFDTDGFSFTRGGEVKAWTPPDDWPDRLRNAALASQFMLAAAEQAVHDAGLHATPEHRRDMAVVLSTNFGGMEHGEALLEAVWNNAAVRGNDVREYTFQSCADHVSAAWQAAGPRLVLSLSCASGTAALAVGAGLIRSGRAQVVLTGGYDALSRFAWSGLSALRTMTKDEIRPFDKDRSGTLFSEGAGAVIIESADHARRRGARAYADVAGCATNNNAHHLTAPAPEGAGSARVMQEALAEAGLTGADVNHVNAHGTATRHNDPTEAHALHTALGPDVARNVPVTSIKSMTGHMMGAAGSVEAIASVLSIRDGIVPPTIHFRELEPDCELSVVANERRQTPIRTVLSNSAGIGGCNAALLLKRTEAL